MESDNNFTANRRQIMQMGAAGLAMQQWLAGGTVFGQNLAQSPGVEQNMIGAYGPWASSILGDGPATMSFRRDEFKDVVQWQTKARERALQFLLQPPVQ